MNGLGGGGDGEGGGGKNEGNTGGRGVGKTDGTVMEVADANGARDVKDVICITEFTSEGGMEKTSASDTARAKLATTLTTSGCSTTMCWANELIDDTSAKELNMLCHSSASCR